VPVFETVTIALDGTPLTVPTGGVARYTLELARALAAEFPQDRYWLLSDQILPQPISFPSNLRFGSTPKTLAERKWWLFGLAREMARRGVDLFHGTDFSVPYIPRRTSVMTLHDLSPWDHRGWGNREWRAGAGRVRRRTPILLGLGLARMVITPSEPVRRAAIERFALSPDRVVAVPLAASEVFRRVETPRTEEASPKPYFLFVGTLEPRKNIGRLIEAWREMRTTQEKLREVDLVLAGRLGSGFPAPMPEPGLRVLGAVPEADLAGLYSGALACVYPSLYEGFGLPVLEAMQCGTVVVTSRDPAITEVSGGNAIHVEATDTRALVEAMTAVARAPENFAELRERALTRAAEFTWQRTARRTREVYETARGVHG
jgi:glycosyltransferase involved in cell wall biosynthesis